MPACSNLYDVFNNICSDEKEHVKTMTACRDYSIVDDLVQVRLGCATHTCLINHSSCMHQAASSLVCWMLVAALVEKAQCRLGCGCCTSVRAHNVVAVQDKKRRGAPGAPQPSATMDTSQLQ